MNKYSYIAILIAIILGAAAGSLFTSSVKNKEVVKLVEQHKKELQKQNIELTKQIELRHLKIEQLEKIISLDSIKVIDLEYKIKQDGVIVNQLRKERKQWTTDEKVKYLIDRYSN